MDRAYAWACAAKVRWQSEHTFRHAPRQRRGPNPNRIQRGGKEKKNLGLGNDGGGTRTRAAVVEGEQHLAFAEAGSIKRLRVGPATAEQNLWTLLTEVYKQAGVKAVHAATAGVASATMPGVPEWIKAVFAEFGVERS